MEEKHARDVTRTGYYQSGLLIDDKILNQSIRLVVVFSIHI